MRRYDVLCWSGLLVFTLAATAGHGQEKDAKKEGIAGVMQRKLAHAQKVLEGVAVNDFDKVVSNAEDLIRASREAGWMVLTTPRYELYSNEFRRSAESLVKYGREKNTDGSALAYVELTLTCVKCHKYVREERMARRNNPE
ncbi:MAG TPA: hypothetical protein VIL46_02810 [Gemmataceae bacterium]